MAKFEGVKRIIKEDFDPKEQSLIEKLAQPLNAALEFIARAFNKSITFDENINCQVKDIEITVDSAGIPKQTFNFKSDLKGMSKGIIVVNAKNLTNVNSYPTGAPFISFDENNGQISIKAVTGIQADHKYRLKIISIG